MLAMTPACVPQEKVPWLCKSLCMSCVGNDDEGAEEVKSKPAKAKAKATKKPILPDSVRASQKVTPAC